MGKDALEQWLAKPLVKTTMDPIAYWSGMLAANHPLSQMALDYLSIPGKFIMYYCIMITNYVAL